MAARMQRGVEFKVGHTIPDPATNVGVLTGVTRNTYGGPTTITTDGAIIENMNISSYITIDTANVTFYNCYFSAGGSATDVGMVDCKTANCSNIHFNRCTFIPSTTSNRRDAVYGHDYTAYRCHIERVVDGFGVVNQYASACNVHITANWIGNLSWHEVDGVHSDGTHNDGVQVHSGTDTWIEGNAFYGYKYNALGTPALDSSANSLYPQIGQIVMAKTEAYYHVSGVHVNRNFIWGGDNGLKFGSGCSIHANNDAGYDAECVDNVLMDDNQRDYGYTWHFYPIRPDSNMTINGIGPFATTGATYDANGNHWSATSAEVSVVRQSTPVFIRCDAVA